jgi:transposase
VRRKFYELADSSPVATDVLRRFAMLYAIEGDVRGSPAEERRTVRVERSRVIVDDWHRYLEASNAKVSAKSKLGEAIRYALPRWDGLSRFIDDPSVPTPLRQGPAGNLPLRARIGYYHGYAAYYRRRVPCRHWR